MTPPHSEQEISNQSIFHTLLIYNKSLESGNISLRYRLYPSLDTSPISMSSTRNRTIPISIQPKRPIPPSPKTSQTTESLHRHSTTPHHPPILPHYDASNSTQTLKRQDHQTSPPASTSSSTESLSNKPALQNPQSTHPQPVPIPTQRSPTQPIPSTANHPTLSVSLQVRQSQDHNPPTPSSQTSRTEYRSYLLAQNGGILSTRA